MSLLPEKLSVRIIGKEYMVKVPLLGGDRGGFKVTVAR